MAVRQQLRAATHPFRVERGHQLLADAQVTCTQRQQRGRWAHARWRRHLVSSGVQRQWLHRHALLATSPSSGAGKYCSLRGSAALTGTLPAVAGPGPPPATSPPALPLPPPAVEPWAGGLLVPLGAALETCTIATRMNKHLPTSQTPRSSISSGWPPEGSPQQSSAFILAKAG